MFKFPGNINKRAARSTFAGLLLLTAFVALTFASVAQAQILLHGATISKACLGPVRLCDDDEDCNTDGDACTLEHCNLAIRDTLYCEYRVGHNDDFNDTISILAAWDVVDPSGDAIRSPAVGDAEIVFVSGNTTCTVGGSLPCSIGPDLGGGAGRVTFVENLYEPTALDPTPLQDRGNAQVQDACDGDEDDGCNSNTASMIQFVAQTNLVSGCVSDGEVTCDDGDPCTTEICNSTSGQCETVDGVTCDDGNACTTEVCNSTTGECETTNTVTCDDGNACTTESCNTTSGECETTDTVTCDDGNACTTESCDTTSGECETTDTVTCDDNNACTTESCNTTSGECETTDTVTCDDNNACTTESCDTGTGECETTDTVTCDDLDPCTDDTCNSESGVCEYVDNGECVPDICLVIIDEEGVDNDFRSIERAADLIGVEPDELINDDHPTETGNPPFLWNELVAGGQVPPAAQLVLLPTGQVDDEGWFAPPPPPDVLYKDNSRPPNCGLAGGYAEWIQRFVAGTLTQHCLDEVLNVMPLRNQELYDLLGRTCVAVVYDSDISMNFEPIFGNLQGGRLGLFTFKVEALELPGSLPESGSSTSLYDLWLRILPPETGGFPYEVEIHDHEPDAAELKTARYRNGILTVVGESDFDCSDTLMTVSVDGPDAGSDPLIDQFLLEEPMLSCTNGRFTFSLNTGGVNVLGRRVSVQTNHGGVYNGTIR